MHPGALFLIVVGATFVAAPAGFTAETPPAAGPATPAAIGSSKPAIAARFGMPSQIVSPELWVYREFYTDHQGAAQRGFDTLVIVFAQEKVIQMRIVNGEMLTAALEARQRAQTAALAAVPPPIAGK